MQGLTLLQKVIIIDRGIDGLKNTCPVSTSLKCEGKVKVIGSQCMLEQYEEENYIARFDTRSRTVIK